MTRKQTRERTPELEVCFFPIPGSFIRVKGGSQLYDTMRKVIYRCGSCGLTVEEDDMTTHYESHKAELPSIVKHQGAA